MLEERLKPLLRDTDLAALGHEIRSRSETAMRKAIRALAELYRRLWLMRTDEGYPPGWVHLPVGIEPEWIRQLVSEQLVTVRDRRGFSHREWQKLRERNEALDCAVLARAALHELGAARQGEQFWPPEPMPGNESPATTRPVRRVRRSDGYAQEP